MTEERLFQIIRENAAKNGGVAYSTQVSSRARQAALDMYGGWQKACIAAGVNPATKIKPQPKPKIEDVEFSRVSDFNKRVAAGINIDRRNNSQCWECGTVTCSWERDLILPKGVVYKTERTIDKWLVIVLFCPYFTPLRGSKQ